MPPPGEPAPKKTENESPVALNALAAALAEELALDRGLPPAGTRAIAVVDHPGSAIGPVRPPAVARAREKPVEPKSASVVSRQVASAVVGQRVGASTIQSAELTSIVLAA
jgi:hypothetical protein